MLAKLVEVTLYEGKNCTIAGFERKHKPTLPYRLPNYVKCEYENPTEASLKRLRKAIVNVVNDGDAQIDLRQNMIFVEF